MITAEKDKMAAQSESITMTSI